MNLIEKLQAKVERLKAISASKDKIETASECLSIAKQHSDWVSVNERLPEREYCEYLVWVGYPDIATYSKLGWELPSDAVVTHWHSLPEPPSEVQDDL